MSRAVIRRLLREVAAPAVAGVGDLALKALTGELVVADWRTAALMAVTVLLRLALPRAIALLATEPEQEK